MVDEETFSYLPEECWECIFRFIIINKGEENLHRSLSLVCKQFLSITNRLRFSLILKKASIPFLPLLFNRFTNLTSLDLSLIRSRDLDDLLSQISNFPLRVTLIIMFASIFPNLQHLDLHHCDRISQGICQVLRRCCNIRHLNLTQCSSVKLLGINFVVPQLEVLNLSATKVDDETLYVISKNCRGLLQLLLEDCNGVTEKGLKQVLKNCTQLTERNLFGGFSYKRQD